MLPHFNLTVLPLPKVKELAAVKYSSYSSADLSSN
jgi:hypothetical protein